MMVCGICGKPIGYEPPNSDGIEMMALINHELNRHWKKLEDLEKTGQWTRPRHNYNL